MDNLKDGIRKIVLAAIIFLIAACNLPLKPPYSGISPILTATAAARMNGQSNAGEAGESNPIVDPSAYIIQSGDTLPGLAARFQTSADEIRGENQGLFTNHDLTTLPPGQALTNLAIGTAIWSPPNLILPNSLFVYGPSQSDFDVAGYLATTNGWLKNYTDNSAGNAVSGAQIVKGTADNYSISPRLILAVLEFQLNALTSPEIPSSFSLGSSEENRKTLGRQLSWAANALNNGYYGWREGIQVSFADPQSSLITPNPTVNAASVAIQYYFSRFKMGEDYQYAISANGLAATYQNLFGAVDWNKENREIILPENLHQPDLQLPFQPNLKWAYTGGPHSGWGIGLPYAAIDFAPPATTRGCDPSPHWAVAMTDGVIARSEGGSVVLDLDGDGNPHTGWSILYLHISPLEAALVGTTLKTGDRIGHPSCVGGSSSGRNLHIARLYNGEWISVGGVIPLVVGGWKAVYGDKEYKGTLIKGDKTLTASSQGEWFSQLSVESP